MTRRISTFVLFWYFASLAGLGFAQGNYTRIARLSYLDGNVSFQHAGDTDWSATSINMPLQEGDRIYTGPQGRVEMQFDEGSILRLAENTDMEILSLEDNLIQARLLLGLSTLTVSSDLDFEIGTPAAAFNTLSKGVYRFDVVEDGNTDGIVRSGSMEAANDQFSRRIRSGELIHIAPGGRGVETVSRYLSRDAWDEWTDRRTADLRASTSARYLPNYVHIGASDLDRHGRWVTVDFYGAAWIPSNLSVGWTPYSIGRWVYRPFWGWTWVSYEPWGWLPYHYGRWQHSPRFGWCWLPGAAVTFNFWSPALVSFYQGPGWVSWCPLGPGDYYNVNRYFFRRNFQNQLNEVRLLQRRAPGDLFNRSVPGAFRTVQTDNFVNTAVGSRGGRMPEMIVDRPFEKGRFINDQPEIKPTARSMAPAPGRAISRPASAVIAPTIVRSEPAVGLRERMTKISNSRIPPLAREPGAVRNDTGIGGDNAPAVNRGGRSGEGAAPVGRQPQGSAGQIGNPNREAADRNPQEGRGSIITPRSQTQPPVQMGPIVPSTPGAERTVPERNNEMQTNPVRRQQTAPTSGEVGNRSPQEIQGSATPSRGQTQPPPQMRPIVPSTPGPARNDTGREDERPQNPERRQQAAPNSGGSINGPGPSTRAPQKATPAPRPEKVAPAPVNRAPAIDPKPQNQETPNREKARQPQELQQVNNYSAGAGFERSASTPSPEGRRAAPSAVRTQQPGPVNIEPARRSGVGAEIFGSAASRRAAQQGSATGANSRTGNRAGYSGTSSPSVPAARDRKGR